MKKGLIVTFVIFLVIFISGCGTTSQAPTDVDYYRGTQGIVVSFMRNSPPSEVFDGDSVPFLVEVRNEGASSTTPYFWLSGHDRGIIQNHWGEHGPATANPSNIEGKTENNPVGGYATLEAPSVQISLPDKVPSYDANMKLTVCYPYTTHASSQVCVDPDPTRNQDDACAAGDISLGSGQAGPVAVTHIEEASSKDKVRFTITISNVGGGTIISKNKMGDCTNLKASDIDVVELGAKSIAGRGMTCKPQPEVRLVNGRGIVYCEAPFSSSDKTAFTTLLSIEISYGYKYSISKSITVKRI